jgi:hypothetical protein
MAPVALALRTQFVAVDISLSKRTDFSCMQFRVAKLDSGHEAVPGPVAEIIAAMAFNHASGCTLALIPLSATISA